jgi:hypothetical protein
MRRSNVVVRPNAEVVQALYLVYMLLSFSYLCECPPFFPVRTLDYGILALDTAFTFLSCKIYLLFFHFGI